MDPARRCRSDRIRISNTALRVTLCLPELKPVDLLPEWRDVYLVQNILLAGSPQYLDNHEENDNPRLVANCPECLYGGSK
jgi:hypothetical protein